MSEFTGSSERARRTETHYFLRRDQETLARARDAQRTRHEREVLAAAIGTNDLEAISRLYTWGMRAASAGLLEWLPVLEVAWLDGIDENERTLLRDRFAASPHWSPAAALLLDEWLARRPSHGLFAAGRRALRARLQAFSAESRQTAIERIVNACHETGQAAGGIFGFGALSGDERRHIAFIRQDLERPL